MNPLQFIFFLTIFVDDYFFKEAKLFNLFMILTAGYWVSRFFADKNPYQTSQRKLIMAAYSQSQDPTVISKIKLRSERAKKCIDALSKKYNKKITWTLYTAKVLGHVLAANPDILLALKFGKGLGLATLREVDKKSIGQLYDEAYPEIKKMREGKHNDLNEQMKIVEKVPSYLLGVVMDTLGYIQNILGYENKKLGMIGNQFGTLMISSLGGFKLSEAIAPLTPFAANAGVVTLCTEQHRKKLTKDGTYEEYSYMPVYTTTDHRYLDGVLGAKMINKFKEYFEHPEKIFPDDSDILSSL